MCSLNLAHLEWGCPEEIANSNLMTAAQQVVLLVDRLQAAGARNIIVATVPDIGTTPFGLSQADGGTKLTEMSSLFNQSLLASLSGRSAVIVDTGKLLTAVQQNPAKYGFTAPNAATIPACGMVISLFCLQGVHTTADSEQRIFADSLHPTAAAHLLFGQSCLCWHPSRHPSRNYPCSNFGST